MTICNFCNKRESRASSFSDAFVCKECYDNPDNYDIDRKGITFIDSSNKRVQLSSDTNIDIISSNSEDEISTQNNIENLDALLASLFTQIEFLKDQIKEKDLVIRTLLIGEQDYYYNYDYGESGCVEEDDVHTRENSSTSEESDNDGESNSVEEQSIASESSPCKSVEDNVENDGGDETIDDEFFQELYKQKG